MKKNKKTILPVLSLITILAVSSTTAFAQYNSDKAANSSEQSAKANTAPNSIVIDGNILENSKTYKSNDKLMIPIRAIAEELGFKVEWDKDNDMITLTKLPQYITFKLHKDEYTFSKIAPMPLGKAPELKDNVTYVPVEILTEIMNLKTDIAENGTITIESEKEAIKHEEQNSEIQYNATISTIEDNYILVNDNEKGEVKLNIGEDTEITKSNGEKASIEDLKEGDSIYVEYSEAMTFSLPPMNNPKKIIINSQDAPQGDITFLEDIKDNKVLVNDSIKGEVLLSISDDTEIIASNGNKLNKSDIKKDMQAKIIYGDVMAESLPPINNPKQIIINSQDAPQGDITFLEDIKDNKVLVNDSIKGEVLLSISDDTEIIASNGNKLNKSDIKKDIKAKITYGDVMTASLHPMNNPKQIIINSDTQDKQVGDIVFSENIKDNQVMVNDSVKGEVLLSISDDTEIIASNGNKLNKSDIKKDMKAKITYGDVMTASLPPMNNPIKIEIVENNSSNDDELKNAISLEGKINEIDEEKMIIFENKEDKTIYALIVDDNTKMTDNNNKTISKDDLKKDTNISVKVSQKMTRSIPPQTYAFEIKVTK